MRKGATYNQYDTGVVLAYSLGLENQFVSKPIQKLIPSSTSDDWRKKKESNNYIGYEVGLAMRQYINDGVAIENAPGLTALNKAYISLFSFFISLLDSSNFNLKKILYEHRGKLTDKIQELSPHLSVKNILVCFGISRATYQNWLHEEKFLCHTSEFNLCFKRRPNQLSNHQVATIKEMLLDVRYKYWSVCALSNFAKQKGIVYSCSSTWSKVKRLYKIGRERPNKKRHPTGIRASVPNQIWHGDISVFKNKSGKSRYLYLLIDNFSRKILGWRFLTVKSGKIWADFLRKTYIKHLPDEIIKPNLWTDDGSEVNNIDMDKVLSELKIKHTVAQKDVPQSNSMIEAVFRIIKKYYFEYEYPDNEIAMVEKLEWFVNDYNGLRPHSAHKYIQTPNQSYETIMPDLSSIFQKALTAREKRKEANRNNLCTKCV